MKELLRKLESLKTQFESVALNTKFKHPDTSTQEIGEKMICDKFAAQIDDIIKCATQYTDSLSTSERTS